jgi:hypothetical protein
LVGESSRRLEGIESSARIRQGCRGQTIHLITIAQEIGGRGVVREGVHDLLGDPGGGGMFGDVEVDDAPAMVGEHDEDA